MTVNRNWEICRGPSRDNGLAICPRNEVERDKSPRGNGELCFRAYLDTVEYVYTFIDYWRENRHGVARRSRNGRVTSSNRQRIVSYLLLGEPCRVELYAKLGRLLFSRYSFASLHACFA